MTATRTGKFWEATHLALSYRCSESGAGPVPVSTDVGMPGLGSSMLGTNTKLLGFSESSELAAPPNHCLCIIMAHGPFLLPNLITAIT